jgi:hypothetical protein
MFPESVAIIVLLIGVCATAAALAAQEDRTAVVTWALLGFLASCGKVWLVVQTPQWLDVSPDSIQYQLHAHALALHWQGEPVNVVSHKLYGLLALLGAEHGGVWEPQMNLAYSSVLGTHEWLYAAMLGGWRLLADDWLFWATYSNAVLAALFPAASYGIARCLGASHRVASAAALITLFDPSSSVNASWLLKDTLAGFLAVTAAWGVVRTMRDPNDSASLVLFIAAACLACVRFAGFSALILGIAIVYTSLFGRLHRRTLKHLSVCVLGSIVLFGTLYSSPKPMTFQSILASTILPLKAQEVTLHAKEGDREVDATVADWQARWNDDPVEATIISAARTLLAPYPWVALTHGLSGVNSIELYYPGVVLWILCLPGILWGIPFSLRRTPREGLFLACMLGALLGAYTLFLGEWSTRQRVFMLPVFYSFAAIGWHDLCRRSMALLASRQSAS